MKMKIRQLPALRLLGVAAASCSLVACDAGSPGMAASDAAERIITRGTITSDNGVAVNGRVFSLATANITIDDQPSSQQQLKSGMQVVVHSQNGMASSVRYEEDVKGPVDSVEANGNFIAMGQSVLLDENTLLDDFSAGQLHAGDVVEVSGTRDASGNLHASYVELKINGVDVYSVRGPVSGVNVNDQTLMLGGLTVDYASAELDDITLSALVDGIHLEVKDANRFYQAGSLFLSASKLEADNEFDFSSDSSNSNNNGRTELEIDAIVTSVFGDDRFELGTLTVRVLPNTRFRDGEAHQLTANVRVEVEGWLNDAGELEAWEIEFEDDSDFHDSSDDDASDDDDLNDDNLDDDNNDRSDDDNNDASGNDASDNSLLEIRGFVEVADAANGTLVVNGVLIQVDNGTQYRDLADKHINRSDFFAQLAEGSTEVKVKWTNFTDYSNSPHEIEIES